MQQTPSVENMFIRAWDLLSRNWSIIVPGVVVGLVVGVITGIFSLVQPAGEPIGVVSSVAHGAASFVSSLIVAIVAVAGYIVTQCYTAGMAGAAWQRGTATLADGARAVNEDAGNVLVAAIGLLICGIIAALLLIPTLGLSIFVFYLFTMYTIAAAVVGNRRGFDALRESFAIARAKFGTTLIIGIVLFLLSLVGNIIGHLFSYAPLLGPIVSAIVTQIIVAYATLVIVGEYLVLRPAAMPPGGPPPPPPAY
jgi:hypothetical protein